MSENKEIKCPCKWVKCPLHGDRDACINHHQTHPNYSIPFCKKYKNKKPKKE